MLFRSKVKVDRIEFQKGGGNSNTEKKTEEPSFELTGLDPQGFQAIDDDDIPF